jgi:hypothetical protein
LEEQLPVPLDEYFDRSDRAALERRLNRDIAVRLGEAVNTAKIKLVEDFCDAAFDVDATGEPIIKANAERAIDNALAPLWQLQDELNRKGGRVSQAGGGVK